MKDLEFISGEFFHYQIPKEKRYLKKYFTGKLQTSFLRYMLVFDTRKNFTNHTGCRCTESLQKRMEIKYRNLVDLYDKSKSALTEEGMKTIQLIESGKYEIRLLTMPKKYRKQE